MKGKQKSHIPLGQRHVPRVLPLGGNSREGIAQHHPLVSSTRRARRRVAVFRARYHAHGVNRMLRISLACPVYVLRGTGAAVVAGEGRQRSRGRAAAQSQRAVVFCVGPGGVDLGQVPESLLRIHLRYALLSAKNVRVDIEVVNATMHFVVNLHIVQKVLRVAKTNRSLCTHIDTISFMYIALHCMISTCSVQNIYLVRPGGVV